MTRILIILILLIGTVVVAVFYLKPAWTDFQHIRARNVELGEIAEEMETLIGNRDELLASVNRISKDDLTRIQQLLPGDPDADALLVTLENLSAKHGVLLRQVDLTVSNEGKRSGAGTQPRPGASVAPTKPEGSIVEQPLSIQIASRYESFKAFLKELEGNPRLLDVREVSFGALENPDAFLNFTIGLTAYYQQ